MSNHRTLPATFGRLTFPRLVSQRVGLPVEEIRRTGEALEQKFYINLEEAGVVDQALANLEVLEIHSPHKARVAKRVGDILRNVKEKGNYENATLAVTEASKLIATDPAFNKALQYNNDFRGYREGLQAERDSGELSESRFNFAINHPDSRPEDLSEPDEFGFYHDTFRGYQPATAVDIQGIADDFLKGFKSDVRTDLSVEGIETVFNESTGKTSYFANISKVETEEVSEGKLLSNLKDVINANELAREFILKVVGN